MYFRLNRLEKKATTGMKVKTIVLLLAYFTPIAFHWFGLVTEPWLVLLLYSISGLGIAGIGMGIMHDANHGAYTRNNTMNYFLSHTLDLMGCSSEIWKLQHNVLHHTYTNIHGHDEDITAPIWLLRFSPHSKHYSAHRFQHLYVWFFYGILTLFWVTGKDFVKAIGYRKKGLIQSNKELTVRLLKLIPLKAFYFTYALIIPIWMTPLPAYWLIIAFVLMHFVAGILLSVVFQLAHVVPEMTYPQADTNGSIENNWYVHQLQTTSNFSPGNKVLAWYLGGLTNQIEHHLFPQICHVHYPNLSKIVQRTAEEYNIPYHVNQTFFQALAGHVNTLRSLGNTAEGAIA